MATAKSDPFDQFLLGRTRPTSVAKLAAHPADAQELNGARQRLTVANLRERAVIETEIKEILERIDLIVFTFGAIGGAAQQELIDSHKADDGEGWDDKTFPPALIAKTCIGVSYPDGSESDGLPEAKAAALWASDRWSVEDKNHLLIKALQADSTGSVVEMGKG